MAKSFEVQGIIHSIEETKTFGNNGFTKREFVVKLSGDGENADYPNYVALELIKVFHQLAGMACGTLRCECGSVWRRSAVRQCASAVASI